VLYLLGGDKNLAQEIDSKSFYISFVTELELLGYDGLSSKDLKEVKKFIGECTIIDINNQIKENTIDLKRKYRIKLPDSIIAATSIFLDIPLLTADLDFMRLEDLDVIIYEVEKL
jgi:predicted nucleic acid-binding protein